MANAELATMAHGARRLRYRAHYQGPRPVRERNTSGYRNWEPLPYFDLALCGGWDTRLFTRT